MRTATIQLRSAGQRVSLPNNRHLKFGETAVISYDDLLIIDPEALLSVVDVTAVEDLPLSRRGYDLTKSYATLTLLKAGTGGSAADLKGSHHPGKVEAGFGPRDLFQIVKAGAAVTAGNLVVWNTAHTTVAPSAAAADAVRFAGIAMGTIANGSYGWVQTDGQSAATAGAVGDPITTAAAGAGALATGSQRVVGVSLGAPGILLRPAGKRHTKIFRR